MSIWMLAAPALLLANPWGSFDWVELTASTGPWVFGLDRRIRPAAVVAIGLALIAVLCLVDGAGASFSRLLVAATVFVVGAGLAVRARGGFDPRAPLDAHERSDVDTLEAFEARLEREFARARRHGKGLALLSLTAHPRAREGSRSASSPARDDAALEALRALLARELRLYADVVVGAGRVLALVPEVESGSYDPFVARVRRALEQGAADFEVRIGTATFPKDAVCVEALVEAADRARSATATTGFVVGASSASKTPLCGEIRPEGSVG